MKVIITAIAFTCSISHAIAQDTITNFKENSPINWGTLSPQKPNFGFYGQEFQFSRNVDLYAISVFIVRLPQYDQSKSSMNFSVWSFDTVPGKELFLSDSVIIAANEIGNWKRYEFKTPLKLMPGRYLLAVGQSRIQGFVAFGNGTARDGYSSKFWIKTPWEGYSDGTTWFDLAKALLSSSPPPSEEGIEKMAKVVVMMKLEYK